MKPMVTISLSHHTKADV